MTPQQLIGLAVRLFAIWLALLGISAISMFGATRHQPGYEQATFFVAVTIAVYLLVALLLWFFPMVIAHRLVPKTRFDNVLNAQAMEVARVGSCLLGLWLLATTVPGVASFLLRVVLTLGNESVLRVMDQDAWLSLLQLGLRVVIGVFLVLGAASLATFLLRDSKS